MHNINNILINIKQLWYYQKSDHGKANLITIAHTSWMLNQHVIYKMLNVQDLLIQNKYNNVYNSKELPCIL